MTPAIIAMLELFAPGILGGIGGTLLGIFQTPEAGMIIAAGKKAARGDHLSEEDKQFVHQYNKTHYRPPIEFRH
jgi:hypothetical protein